jgi:excinuclease ABC subunit A
MGVATHNLKNIDVTIPVNRLTVITGVSGSGKSSLAFDTLFAEGQMRYLTRFSTYARRLMVNSAGTDICLEESFGLTPTIAVNQSAAARNPRSTVGTMTEIYDYYRLLFARVGVAYCPDCGSALENGICSDCGFLGHSTLTAGMFSFNHHQGACPRCNGLGIITTCDPVKLVSHPERSMLGGALDGSKTGKFYGDPYGQYTAILRAVGESEGIDFSCPWESLDQQARRIAMFGTGETIYDVTWKYKRKNREGLHRFETAWKGFVEYVNEEYQRKHADKRGQSMLPLMTDLECPVCSGQRLKPEYLSVYFVGLNIAQLCNLTVKESIEFFNRLQKNEIEDSLKTGVHGFDRENIEKAPWSPTTAAITVELRREVVRRLVYLEDVGLGYLTLNRDASSLSGGEAQRIRLAGQLGGGLTGITYVLDEPTIGLHSRDTQRLLSVLKELRDQGNTIVVVEHDAEVIRAADHIIDMGPGSGAEGGRIVAEGTVRKLENNRESKTGFYLKHPDTLKAPGKLRTLQAGIKITGANANNLKQLDMEIPSGGIIAVTGVSGSGKSSLVFDVLAATAKNGNASGCETFEGLHRFDAVVMVDQKSIGSSPSSNPATYTGVFDEIRDVFAKTDYARSKGYKKNRFSFNVKGGRCENCQGMGRIRTSMDFLADVWTLCEECGGKRYNQETLHCLVKEKSIADVLEMTIREAVEFFCDRKKIAAGLKMMEDVGLGYCRLGQPANTLSGGESQRLKLVTQLIKGIDGKRNLYLFDEPTTGLHFEDIRRLLSLFHRLADAGHTLVVIEHNPDIIKNADYIIDLGPEGGDGGGLILAQGTPEEIRQNSRSFTGKIL